MRKVGYGASAGADTDLPGGVAFREGGHLLIPTLSPCILPHGGYGWADRGYAHSTPCVRRMKGNAPCIKITTTKRSIATHVRKLHLYRIKTLGPRHSLQGLLETKVPHRSHTVDYEGFVGARIQGGNVTKLHQKILVS